LAFLPFTRAQPFVKFPMAERLGRVNVGMAEIKGKPDADSKTVAKVYEDAVVPWEQEVTQLTSDDVKLCQITSSSNQSDIYSIPLIDYDFESGKLDQASTIRPNRIFTADSNIMIRNVGLLTSQKVKEVVDKIEIKIA
jgi:hypothetical protein